MPSSFRVRVLPLPTDAIEHGLPVDPALPSVTLWEECSGPGVTMVLRPVPTGKHRVGSRGVHSDEEPVHEVELPVVRGHGGVPVKELPACWMADAPVTVAQFARWRDTPAYERWFETYAELEGMPSARWERGSVEGNHPATEVTWFEAVGYCDWLNGCAFPESERTHRSQAGNAWTGRFVVPMEELWEVACRAGTRSEYASGDDEDSLGQMAWFAGGGTRPVRGLHANRWGLYDMHGNVLEWCIDEWADRAYACRLGGEVLPETQPVDLRRCGSALRVVRGGSWGLPARDCRSAFRSWWLPGNRLGGQGFRVALLPGPGGVASGCGASNVERAEAEGGAAAGGGTPEQRAPDDAGAAVGDPWDELRLPTRPILDPRGAQSR